MTKTYILNKNLKGKLQRKSCVSLSKSARPSLNLAGNLVESAKWARTTRTNRNQKKEKAEGENGHRTSSGPGHKEAWKSKDNLVNRRMPFKFWTDVRRAPFTKV